MHYGDSCVHSSDNRDGDDNDNYDDDDDDDDDDDGVVDEVLG